MEVSLAKLKLDLFNSYLTRFKEPIEKPRPNDVKRASVLLPFAVIKNELKIIVTVRNPSISNYPVETSFPGGKYEDGDKDSIATALREAREEIGLNPKDITIIGSIDDLLTLKRGNNTDNIPRKYIVSLVIGVLKRNFSLSKNHDEVDEIIIGSVDFMFSWLQTVRFGTINAALMRLNKDCDINLYGFSAHVMILVCIVLDLVPKHCIKTLQHVLIQLGQQSTLHFPHHVMDFLMNKFDAKLAARM